METLVTYRLKGEPHIRTFTTAQPVNAMLNLLPDVDMMYATGTYRPARAAERCCGDKYCVFERELNDGMEGW